MGKLTNTVRENITIRNEIMIDGVSVKSQQCNLNVSNPEDMDISDWVVDRDLYKENRTIIRKCEADFEDMCYERQNKLLEQLTGGTANEN